MKPKALIGIIIVGLILIIGLVLLFSGISTYNKMVRLDEGVTEKWSQVENDYQRRADLIPNLVKTVRSYAEYEQETLTEVVEARAKATSVTVDPTNLNAQSIQQFQQAQEGLTSALSKLLVVVEKYPDLKANQNYMDLQRQLEGTENRISNARRKFNEATRDYNTYIRRFFPRMLASWFGFEQKTYFEAKEGAEEAPDVGDYLD
ncbi:MAG: LemA family protein [Bacteroidetes bacterium]|nr:MAG: LemA family protein [Bacteroidota bacterium]